MPNLDVRLAQGRIDLLDDIEQPPLQEIRDRAAARRRWWRGFGRGGFLAGIVAAALIVAPAVGPGDQPPTPDTDPPAVDVVYAAGGITIDGLPSGDGGDADTGRVRLIAGTITDVEFADPEHGYLLTACPAALPCQPSVGRSSDGGRSWETANLPEEAARSGDAELLAFPDGRLLITGERPYASTDQGRSWHPAGGSGGRTGPAPAGSGDQLRSVGGSGRCGGGIEVWPAEASRGGPLPSQPALDVCWAAAFPAADGARWVGGLRDGRAALAVTRDQGRSWQTIPLGAPAQRITSVTARPVTSVEVSGLGHDLYAAVLGPGRALIALFHSADDGTTFTRTAPPDSAGSPANPTGPADPTGLDGPDGLVDAVGDRPEGLAGTLVPMSDGRLLAAGTDHRWYVSADRGRTFTRLEGTLPAVGRLTRTGVGYVAYDLFGSGWAAYSANGVTWRKLPIN